MFPGPASLNAGVNEGRRAAAASTAAAAPALPRAPDGGLSRGQRDPSRCPQPPSPGDPPVHTGDCPAVRCRPLGCPSPGSYRPSTHRPPTPRCPGGARALPGTAGVPSPAVPPPRGAVVPTA